MTVKPVGTFGIIEHRVEERLIVVSPFWPIVGIGNLIWEIFTCVKMSDLERVALGPIGIGRIGDKPVVKSDRESTKREVVVPLGELVQIEQHLLVSIKRSLLATVDRILLPLVRTRVVIVVVEFGWYRDVGLLDAPQDFLVELLLKPFGRLHHGLGVAILRFEILDHLWVVALAKPVVIVGARLVVYREILRNLLRHGWFQWSLYR